MTEGADNNHNVIAITITITIGACRFSYGLGAKTVSTEPLNQSMMA
jgi:hypothetical protein